MDSNVDLVTWHQTVDAKKDWKSLRSYLTAHLSVPHDIQDFNPKCWYTEMEQLDINSQDVEHFRPKDFSKRLTTSHRTKIEREIGYSVPEDLAQIRYTWLELNHNNYRFTTALSNRGGGKHSAFPVLTGTARLISPTLPTGTNEFPLLLDPTIEHDANQLLVIPSGEIMPKATKIVLTANDLANYQQVWYTEPINFLRSWVSIFVYRLDNPHLIKGRKIVFSKVINLTNELEQVFGKSHDATIFICKEIQRLISSFSQFALAARCALLSYDGNNSSNVETGKKVQQILTRIYENVIDREKNAL
ncbi:hypothetical protein [Chitinophaga sp. MD30]|uniref:hypothetical protein n=1 Tax=Chitinophaga sp. MD30 TaxID=2033437 RepID=UPI0012FE1950|nr:hypothetical protein [Chitinophaga sp. MD30]